ncbi:MAG: RsmB/NOP family class I SAM-dependent RNA methyltransferase [Victivallaceae bacterium]|nr:RsmB/NOP family class I SAM-dependent RNA methyltransferase [Victivallaceae bacterium]
MPFYQHTAEQILNLALDGLTKWASAQIGIDDYLDRQVPSGLRPPVSSLLFEYFRYKTLLDRLIGSKCARMPKPRYQHILALALTQCLFQTGIGKESAVNVAVAATLRKYGRSAGGFVNGVLRNILRSDPEKYRKEALETPLYLFPEILRKRWEKRFSPDELAGISGALLGKAPLTFRPTGDLTAEELAQVKAVKFPAFDWAPGIDFFSVSDAKELFRLGLFENGRIYAQDPAAALAPCMPRIRGGEKVLDMCAAPGGKTLLLAERLGGSGKLVAADRSAKRQELTRKNFACRKLDCEIIVAAAEELKFPPESFDIVLADLPCTNTGVFRHKPDAPWRFTEDVLAETVKLQLNILQKAAALVAPGGQIVYSTCSIEYEENQGQIGNFLEKNSNFRTVKQKLLLPDAYHDGAFSAIIVKN